MPTPKHFAPEPNTVNNISYPDPWYCQLSGEDGLAALKVSGKDRVSFLNGQLTNNVSLLTPTTTMLAGWCNNKGRLVTICQLVDWQDAIWLIMPADVVASVQKKLGMYVLRAAVKLEIAEVTIVGLGDGADGDTASDDTDVYADENGFIAKVCGDNQRSIYLIPDVVDVDNDEIDEVAPGYFWLRGIQAGIPRILSETQEEFVAQQVNLDLLDGISFKKGCYIGQEIVARTQNLGRIKRRSYLYRIAGAANVAPGSKLYAAGQAAGQVVDAISDGAETHFLAVVGIDKLDQALSLDEAGSMVIERLALPYTIPESAAASPE
jgi:tRNA-modifying protein YgfZ